MDMDKNLGATRSRRKGPDADDSAAQASVYARLRFDVLSGQLSANERLKVTSLAERYQTSANPVRARPCNSCAARGWW